MDSEKTFLERLNSDIEENMANENFGVNELAEIMGISRSHFHRKLQATSHKSISQYIRERRIEKAHHLLKTTDLTVAEIGYKVGFSSPNYFSKCFNDVYNCAPGEFRKKINSTSSRKSHDKRWVYIVLIVFIASVVTAVISFTINNPEKSATESSNLPMRIAVIPFHNINSTVEYEYISYGMVQELNDQLVKINGLKVIPRSTMQKYQRLNLSATEVARELDLKHIIVGSLTIVDSVMKVAVQLIDVESDSYLWSESYENPLSDIMAIQRNISENVVKTLGYHLPLEERFDNNASMITDNAIAYLYYLKALYNLRVVESNLRLHAQSLLKKAITLDTSFAEAYAALGESWSARAIWHGDLDADNIKDSAQYYLEKAQTINPELAVTYEYLAGYYLFHQWDFKSALNSWKRNIELKPKQMVFPHGYVDFLLAMGKYGQALKQAEENLRYDNENPTNWIALGLSYYFNGDIENANKTFNHTLKNYSNLSIILSSCGRYFTFVEKYEMAINVLNLYIEQNNIRPSRVLGNLAIAYYHIGNQKKAEELITELKLKSDTTATTSPAFYIAAYYAKTGKTDEAFEWLDKSYREREVEMYWVMVEPYFEEIRSDKRFINLIESMGFNDLMINE